MPPDPEHRRPGELLASDADRDIAAQRLAEAYGVGRLTSDDLALRTDQALVARTHGDLDRALHGLGGFEAPVRRRPLRTAVFWVIALLCSPFLLFGLAFVTGGTDLGDRLFGLVLLGGFGPMLWSVRRWARPRR